MLVGAVADELGELVAAGGDPLAMLVDESSGLVRGTSLGPPSIVMVGLPDALGRTVVRDAPPEVLLGLEESFRGALHPFPESILGLEHALEGQHAHEEVHCVLPFPDAESEAEL